VTCLLIGLGGLFAGVTAPLLSAFVPPLVRDALGDRRTLIGLVMAVDNALLLLLVPIAGAASDRTSAGGGSRLTLVLTGFLLAAAGMALFPWAPAFGLAGVAGAMILTYSGINLQRSPLLALLADIVPSRYRSLANGSVTFQMCVGAVVFLMLGRILGIKAAFLSASVSVLVITMVSAIGLREPPASRSGEPEATLRSLFETAMTAVRGDVPGIRAIFIATFLLQLTFQTFTTWYALHGTERFAVRPEDVTIGFIAWALGGVLGALPAGMLGIRIGRRNAMLAGFALMGVCLLALHIVTDMAYTVPLLALASASWTMPMVNAYPLFVEGVPPGRRGVLAAMFLLCMAMGGLIGDPMNGGLFDAFGGYRPLFLMMAAYTALAFVAVFLVPRGTGEASAI
jgi:MFS family permease